MAKRSSRTTRTTSTRAARAKSKKPAADVDVAVTVQEAPGMGVEAAIGVATSVLLVLAILFTDKLLSKVDSGVFF